MANARIKKIPSSEVRVGMFIHEFSGDWMNHPFFRTQFTIVSENEIQKIRDSSIQFIYIDTSRGLDVASVLPQEDSEANIERSLIEPSQEALQQEMRVSFREELESAMKVKREAEVSLSNLMNDARAGRKVEIEQAANIVQDISDSLARNASALVYLLRLKQKDSYTFQHSISVSALLVAFSRAMGMPQEDVLQVGIGGLMHDIGKAKVDDSILNKSGRLSDEEFENIKKHTTDGHQILQQVRGIGPIPLDIVLHHHERHDGMGYPEQLSGGEISTVAKMAAIVDVYDAITGDRCYHKAIPAVDALHRLYEWSQHHLDPSLVQNFIRCIGIYPVGTLVMLESGRLAVVADVHESNTMTPKVNVFFNTKTNAIIKPEAIDLSKPVGSGGGDRIVMRVSAEKWNVDPARYLCLT